MERTFTVEDSTIIDAPASELYAWISDVARMGEWSPENKGASVSDGGRTHVGAVFVGHNTRGRFSWVTRCTVTAAEPGRRFAFRVHAIGQSVPRVNAPIATWEYRFEEREDGTLVTESWTDDRRSWPAVVARVFDWAVTGGNTFAEFQRGNIRRTLRNLKTAVESRSAP